MLDTQWTSTSYLLLHFITVNLHRERKLSSILLVQKQKPSRIQSKVGDEFTLKYCQQASFDNELIPGVHLKSCHYLNLACVHHQPPKINMVVLV